MILSFETPLSKKDFALKKIEPILKKTPGGDFDAILVRFIQFAAILERFVQFGAILERFGVILVRFGVILVHLGVILVRFAGNVFS